MFRSIDQFYGLPLSVGIFAYLNYHVPRTRREILEILLKGLQRLEYRGYDSAGKQTHLLLTLVEWHCCSDTEACVCVCVLSACLFFCRCGHRWRKQQGLGEQCQEHPADQTERQSQGPGRGDPQYDDAFHIRVNTHRCMIFLLLLL